VQSNSNHFEGTTDWACIAGIFRSPNANGDNILWWQASDDVSFAATLREQVAELSKELSFTKGLLSGSGAGRLKFFTVRGQFRDGERYDRTDVVTRGDAWYVAKRDDPRTAPGDDGEDWQIGPIGRQGEPGRAGERGLRGREGAAGRDAARVLDWTVHRAAYCAVAKMSDGKAR